MIKKFLSGRKINILCGFASVVLMWVAWIIAYYSVKNDYLIPSFQSTFAESWKLLGSAEFWSSFGMTFLRTLEAFAISLILAAACAALSAVSKIFSAFLKPVTIILRTLPTLAVMLLILVWSSAVTAPVIVTCLVLFPMMLAQFNAAICGVDGGLIQMAKVYGVSKKDILFKIYLPQISPNILSQTGANVSLGLKLTISAEVLAATYNSLGGLMQTSSAFVEIPRLAALTIAAVVLGLILDVAFSQLKRVNSKWQGSVEF